MALREGRAKLKDGSCGAAMVFFKKALMISKRAGDQVNPNKILRVKLHASLTQCSFRIQVQQRRAMRGLAAARRMQGDATRAIEDYLAVLQLSKARIF